MKMVDWVVVIEAVGEGSSALSIEALRLLMQFMADQNPTTLYSPERYALQVVVSAGSAEQALSRGLSTWREAQERLGLEPSELARAEVITGPEFEREVSTRARGLAASAAGSSEDLSELLLRQAFHDPATGLPDAELFADHVRRALLRTQRTKGQLALLLFDLGPGQTSEADSRDEFPHVVLTTLSERLGAAARGRDSVGRMSYERFALLVEGVSERASAAIGARVLNVLRAPVVDGDKRHVTPVRLGMATSKPGDNAESLLKRAEMALRRTDANGYRRGEPSRSTLGGR
jgi:diguanylate cyclase (GGDEF)-like protein